VISPSTIMTLGRWQEQDRVLDNASAGDENFGSPFRCDFTPACLLLGFSVLAGNFITNHFVDIDSEPSFYVLRRPRLSRHPSLHAVSTLNLVRSFVWLTSR
jgi:hypothetical protein